ncbi:MAG: DUF1028 domain-containing protein [Candidatus Eisenbacteria bacterium]
MKIQAMVLAVLVVCVVVIPDCSCRAERPTGTFSIVAYDSVTGELGVVVQSRAFGVGAAVAWAEAGVGAIATQAQTNQSFGPRGLDMLRSGLGSGEVLELLLESDPGRENRQIGIIDGCGAPVNFTGSECLVWAGGVTGTGYACQGNILASEEVVTSMATAFEETGGELAERLLGALVAAQAAGGDKRGMQSAALLVVRPSETYPEYNYRYVDLRVEDHTDPINELIRLYRLHEKSDLLFAHTRYVAYYDSTGRADLADRERKVVGGMLKRALADKTDDADLLNGLAWFCGTADLFLDEALEAAERAVGLQPEAAYILDTLAEVQFRLGMIDEAIATGEKAAALDPESTYYKGQLDRFKSAR